jgi:hypothetical protein
MSLRTIGPARGAAAVATEIGPGDPDYARLWKLVNDRNGNRYELYQSRTTRPIPVVALRASN